MIRIDADIDIDVADRDKFLSKINHVVARIDREDGYEKHNTGVYFQDIPRNPLDNIATIDHRDAEDLGYFKVDFLNVHFYKDIKSEEHLDSLLDKEPMWELLQHEEFVSKLFHINNHFELVNKLKPTSVEELAMILAIIRPSKSHLKNKEWNAIKKEVWLEPRDGYFFKRSHAFSYAMAIVAQMNLLTEKYS